MQNENDCYIKKYMKQQYLPPKINVITIQSRTVICLSQFGQVENETPSYETTDWFN